VKVHGSINTNIKNVKIFQWVARKGDKTE